MSFIPAGSSPGNMIIIQPDGTIPGVPSAANSAPPSIAVNSSLGTTATAYARADHTHASSVQRKIIQTTVTNGVASVTWTFATPYAVVPDVTATPQNLSSSGAPYLVNVSAVSLTSVTFQVWQLQVTTLSGTLTAIAGTVISPFVAAPAGVSINCWAALPTA